MLYEEKLSPIQKSRKSTKKLDAIVFEEASFSYTGRNLFANLQLDIQKGTTSPFLALLAVAKAP